MVMTYRTKFNRLRLRSYLEGERDNEEGRKEVESKERGCGVEEKGRARGRR